MAVKIRLRQQGRTNRQTYRLVVADSRSPRDGKYIEMLGWYQPMEAQNNLFVNSERVNHWLAQGAEISEQAKVLLSKAAPDVYKTYNEKLQAKRTKMTAKRRANRKKVAAPKAAQPAKAAKTAAPKKKAAPKKAAKKAAE
jgi:small subunit ribosomal protein S16